MSSAPLSAQIEVCGDVLAQRIISGHALTREDMQSLLSACRKWQAMARRAEDSLDVYLAALRLREAMDAGLAQPKAFFPDAGLAEADRRGVLLRFPVTRRAVHSDHLHGDGGAA
jgi:hypothetical protein